MGYSTLPGALEGPVPTHSTQPQINLTLSNKNISKMKWCIFWVESPQRLSRSVLPLETTLMSVICAVRGREISFAVISMTIDS